MAQRQPHLTPHPCVCSGLWLAPKLNPASHGTRFSPPLEGRQWLSQPSLGLLCWMRSWYILADDGRYEVWVHLKMAKKSHHRTSDDHQLWGLGEGSGYFSTSRLPPFCPSGTMTTEQRELYDPSLNGAAEGHLRQVGLYEWPHHFAYPLVN